MWTEVKWLDEFFEGNGTIPRAAEKLCREGGDVTQKPDRLDNTAVFFVNDGLVGGNMSEDDNKHDENEISGIFSHILPFDKNKYRKKTLK